MIGYIQSMETGDILREVNTFAQKEFLAAIVLSNEDWQVGGVSRLDQHLDRPVFLPAPFDLRHLWLDLRQHYLGTAKKHKNKRK